MFSRFFPNAAAIRTIAAALVLALTCQVADAQIRPFLVKGGGPAPEGFSVAGAPSPFTASGKATLVGKYTGDDGIAIALSFDPATGKGTFKGTYTFVAENGDRLAMTFGDTSNGARKVGTFEAIPVGKKKIRVKFLAEFNPIIGKSTGFFEKVTRGRLIMLAVTKPFPFEIDDQGFTPPFKFDWRGKGFLQFRRGRR